MKKTILIMVFGLTAIFSFSQSEYLPNKKGAYSYYNNSDYLGTGNPAYEAFGKNGKTLSDYFFQNISLMNGLKGFDLAVTLFGSDSNQNPTPSYDYGLNGELRFDFQLFLISEGKEGKWTVEPPDWKIMINNTHSGNGGGNREGDEGSFLKELFVVFPLIRELAPGIRYYDCENRSCGSIIVFNPDRPPFWLPVTVREVATAKMKYYRENDKMVYDFIKPLIDKMSEAELNAFAYNQSEDGILDLNGKREGLQYMRFNPEYWDRTLPISDIQFITINYNEYGIYNKTREEQENAEKEFLLNNQHINYFEEINKLLPLKGLPTMIKKNTK